MITVLLGVTVHLETQEEKMATSKTIKEYARITGTQVLVHNPGNYQIRDYFDNGYGLSIICDDYSYGGQAGLLEVALLYNSNLTYDDSLGFADVRGWLTVGDVLEIRKQIMGLPRPKEEKNG